MEKILIVDKDITNLIATKALMASILDNCEVLTATSARECLLRLEQDVPDILLISANLNGFGGINLVKVIKSGKHSQTPILLIANESTTSEEKIAGLEFGADALVNAPLNFPELSAQIKALLRIRNLEARLISENSKLNIELESADKKLKDSEIRMSDIHSNLPIGIATIDKCAIVYRNKFFMDLTNTDENITSISSIISNWDYLTNLINRDTLSESFSTKISLKTTDEYNKEVVLMIRKLDKSKFTILLLNTKFEEKEIKLKDVIVEIYRLSNQNIADAALAPQLFKLIGSVTQATDMFIGIYEPVENVIEILYSTSHKTPVRLNASSQPFNMLIQTRKLIHLTPEQVAYFSSSNNISLCCEQCYWLGIPLVNNGKFLGFISYSKKVTHGDFTFDEKENLTVLTGVLSGIIDTRMTNRFLQIALHKAQQSEKLKDNFLSNISHEIRTPLNSIIGFTSMLYDDVSKSEKIEYLRMIEDGGKNLLMIIDDIVDIAKIQSGELEINQLDTNIVDIFLELKDHFDHVIEIEKADIKLELELPSLIDRLVIKTDPFRFKQIIENLLQNAVKFTEKGVIHFGFNYLNSETLNVFVNDTGVGIPKSKLSKVFDRFVQIETGHVRSFGGNGLGLSIVKKLVELLNGHIFVESEEGIGSKFYFQIPIEQMKFSEVRRSKANYNWQGKKILLVDDIPSNLEYLEILLKRTSASTSFAHNGLKAIEILARNPKYDLILMDLQMPVMDGYRATRIIKSKYPNIKVIAQTAFSEGFEKTRAFEAGCDDYIVKPIKVEQLMKLIDKHLVG